MNKNGVLIALQLNITEGFAYEENGMRKWANRKDWLLQDHNGNQCIVSNDIFMQQYDPGLTRGTWIKSET